MTRERFVQIAREMEIPSYILTSLWPRRGGAPRGMDWHESMLRTVFTLMKATPGYFEAHKPKAVA